MAVALATLPLKSLLVDDGDDSAGAATGSGRVTGFTEALRTGAAGLAAFLPAVRVTGLAAGFLAGLVFGAALDATFLIGAGFFATTLPTAAFFAGVFLVTTFLAATFLAGAFLAAAFFVGAAFFAVALAGAFLTAGFGAAFFTAARAAGLAADLADDLPALFTIRSLPAAAFDLPAAALADVLPLFALVAVELALVFAISLHRSWPWRPGVIADVLHTGKPFLEYLYHYSPPAVPAR